MKKIIFISSTGGHLSELLQLHTLFDHYDYHLITEYTKSNIPLKDIYKKKMSFLMYGTKHNLLTYLFIFPINCIRSLYLYFKLKPDVIISTGAHTAVPMCFIAHFFKKKVIFIETFANIHTKTLSGRFIYPIADCFIVQWESMLELYPKAIYLGWIF
ncbi:polysaccharide biosynthesis protein [Clostridiaceae bacterium DONG20-135]|uniref:Polysaccharide biosynthesis protein n=1 Tax=Copranaerobaculum intestinale TaxID=2692629 RepID=A0A6N8U458_9FIRM|nr:PssD/Cps14F family polysaccharide biosynthesis glycosyltransferase [Copranaerobaculum intestinale]MXQ72978.1 polysaccharide biosynthesis protein [Copranaerobaculum intestinale]